MRMANAPIRQILAANVRRLRESKGLSQGALATDAGIYQELVSRIENGVANPELETLGKIADALGVLPHELLMTL
jgi:transcriptional regulator with XRE-family HTH domain